MAENATADDDANTTTAAVSIDLPSIIVRGPARLDLLGLFGVLKYILAGRKAQAAPTVVARREAIVSRCV